MVLDELRRIGFSNILDYMRVTDDGDAFLDLSAIDRDKGACVKYFVCEDYTFTFSILVTMNWPLICVGRNRTLSPALRPFSSDGS